MNEPVTALPRVITLLQGAKYSIELQPGVITRRSFSIGDVISEPAVIAEMVERDVSYKEVVR
jgi:hypothetical protein